jgi:hypothetical protein
MAQSGAGSLPRARPPRHFEVEDDIDTNVTALAYARSRRPPGSLGEVGPWCGLALTHKLLPGLISLRSR